MTWSAYAPPAPDTGRADVARRRTVAVISHPDAGKTTLTEQLLAHAGVVSTAGQVKSRTGRQTTTDWMAMEQDRGISVTSSAVRIETDHATINLLDTPGHGDFSEDTYRVLSAVDAAIMLLDAAKGIEEQTRRLFEVCRARDTPIITVLNKFDRPAQEALELLHEIEQDLELVACPLTWPVGQDRRFLGEIRLPDLERVSFDESRGVPTAEEWEQAAEEAELAWEAAGGFDPAEFVAGRLTPVLCASAVRGWGIGDLLDVLQNIAPAPRTMDDADGTPRRLDDDFSGYIFKLQSNMDPRHRDVAAFVRVASGTFERGMKATVASTGKPLVIAQAHEPFGRDRDTIDHALPGDVIVIPGATGLGIGDTLHTGAPVQFPSVPVFAPTMFREVVNRDVSRRKQFQRGLDQLTGEGVVQLVTDPSVGLQRPIAAAGGALQFEVFDHRMREEFGVDIRLDELPYQASAQTDEPGAAAARSWMGAAVFERSNGSPLIAFPTIYALDTRRREFPELRLDDVLS